LKPAMLQGDKLFVWPSMKMKWEVLITKYLILYVYS
jgi:hypothetical protein